MQEKVFVLFEWNLFKKIIEHSYIRKTFTIHQKSTKNCKIFFLFTFCHLRYLNACNSCFYIASSFSFYIYIYCVAIFMPIGNPYMHALSWIIYSYVYLHIKISNCKMQSKGAHSHDTLV